MEGLSLKLGRAFPKKKIPSSPPASSGEPAAAASSAGGTVSSPLSQPAAAEGTATGSRNGEDAFHFFLVGFDTSMQDFTQTHTYTDIDIVFINHTSLQTQHKGCKAMQQQISPWISRARGP